MIIDLIFIPFLAWLVPIGVNASLLAWRYKFYDLWALNTLCAVFNFLNLSRVIGEVRMAVF